MQEQELLEIIVREIVAYPEHVRVSRQTDEMGVLLSLDVHPEDMGKVIGRSGETAKAIRLVLRVIGMKHQARINIKINEPEGGRRAGTVRNGYIDVAHNMDEVMGELKVI